MTRLSNEISLLWVFDIRPHVKEKTAPFCHRLMLEIFYS